jgi:two-component system, OmpR family, phosphate regulon sensor histidine kinase PhoR
MKFQVRLFITFFSVILVVVLASSFWLVDRFRDDLRANMTEELRRYVETGKRLLEAEPPGQSPEFLDAFCGHLSNSLQARFTVIGGGGEVRGDSDVPFAQLPGLENHASRKEVAQAGKDGLGTSSRFSETVKRELTYVAVSFRWEGQPFVLRVGKNIGEVESLVGRLSQPVYIAVLMALALALALSLLASSLLSRDLRNIGRKLWRVRAPADLKSQGTLPDNEFLFIERSIDSMAKELDVAIAELVRERDRLGEVIEAMQAAVVVSDADGTVVISNAAACEMFSGGQRMNGRSLSEVVRVPAIHDQLRSPPDARLESFEFELMAPLPRGCVGRMSRPATSAGSILVVHDVTELRRLEKVRSDLVANVSHELRTPVSVIRANAETLLDGAMEDPSAARTFLQAIDRSSQRLAAILRDLLDLARIESGTLAFAKEEVDFCQLARAIVDSFEGVAEERGLTLKAEVQEGTLVFGDPGAMEQVLTNFVDNALKYTPEGGHVTLRAAGGDGVFRGEVHDTGAGIAPDYRERVFERFFRVDHGRSRDAGGTGLGLSIVKNLVAQMGGTVGFEQAEPHGSIFYFEVPESEA